ncbi:MAG: polysaccharide deacetylase family protein, partial [Clostridia bacterium]|nr:polysaccharide deacetylase family protein [Clostridia bacterium]
MKRIIKNYAIPFFTLLSILISAPSLGAAPLSDDTPLNWYCRHTKGEATPQLDSQFGFIEDCGAIYIDKSAGRDRKTVYLTFDAGYENGNVEKILDVLREKNVTGAFFILENLAKRNPELVRRMADEGHLVCNHTSKHLDMTTVKTEEEFDAELDSLVKCVKENTGVDVAKFYRPPEGRFNKQNLEWAKNAGYTTVFWSFAYVDWDNDHQMRPADAIKKITDGAHPGEILLLHPTSSINAEILSD